MRVIRSSGQNVSPSDDGRLYQQAFEDGLFESTTINSLGGNLVSIGAMYGIMQGRDFTVEAQNINVELPSEDDATGYIYIQFDTTTEDVITVESALAPFTPVYDDINTGGTICQMIIAEYTANAVAVTTINSSYPTASTKSNPTLVGSVAQIETSPATASHSVGQYLFYNGQLYEVTAAISVGETLIVGTNIVATSVGDEISDLKSDITNTTLSGGFASGSIGYRLVTWGSIEYVLIGRSGNDYYFKVSYDYYQGANPTSDMSSEFYWFNCDELLKPKFAQSLGVTESNITIIQPENSFGRFRRVGNTVDSENYSRWSYSALIKRESNGRLSVGRVYSNNDEYGGWPLTNSKIGYGSFDILLKARVN